MKNLIKLFLIVTVIAAFSCNRASEPFGFYRPSHPQNFITSSGSELYAYAANDTVLIRGEYYIKIQCQVKNYGKEILDYGFCWDETNPNPIIKPGSQRLNKDSSLTILIKDKDTIAYTGAATRLQPVRSYYIRSYIITGDGQGNPVDTGYNPKVLYIETKDAVNEWEAASGGPIGERFGALAFNFGDSVFVGTGRNGLSALLGDMRFYNPLNSTWSDFPGVKAVTYHAPFTTNKSAGFFDGIGFGIEFTPNNGRQGERTRIIYVGLGDHVGDDDYFSKSNVMQYFDFEAYEWKESENKFGGTYRSGAVCFVLGENVYVGTGKCYDGLLMSDWYVFNPADDRDMDPGTIPWKTMSTNIPGGALAKGRTGAIAFSMNGKGYFGLGLDQNGKFLNDFYVYENTSNNSIGGNWSGRKAFPGCPRQNAVAFVIGDQAFVGLGDTIRGNLMGGTYTRDQIFDDIYRYDPYNNRWEEIRDYTYNSRTRRFSKKVTNAVGYSIGNYGYAGFGIVPDSINAPQQDLWLYKPYEAGNK
jgi:N-acetylneuraminic acid mutarotase